jgi:hypothetical protein
MQMDVQERRSCNFHAPLQRLLDVLEIVKPLCAEQIYEQMGTSKPNSISLDEVVFPVVVRHMRALTMIFLLGGA